MSYYSCPLCDAYFFRNENLQTHLIEKHPQYQQPRDQGWFETKQPTKDGDVAVLHQIAALKKQLDSTQRTPLQVNLPIPPPQKQDISPIHPWSKNADNIYSLQTVINQKVNPFSTTVDMIRGRLTNDKGIILLHHYEKNTSEIVSLSEKAKTLEDRAQGYTYNDFAFLSIIEQLQSTKKRIKELSDETPADEVITTILERYYRGKHSTPEHDQFKTQFMQDSLKEIERLSGNLKREKEAEEVNKFQK